MVHDTDAHKHHIEKPQKEICPYCHKGDLKKNRWEFELVGGKCYESTTCNECQRTVTVKVEHKTPPGYTSGKDITIEEVMEKDEEMLKKKKEEEALKKEEEREEQPKEKNE